MKSIQAFFHFASQRTVRPIVLQSTAFTLAFLLSVFFSPVLAQSCPAEIKNNVIELKPTACANSSALLQGAVPTGGNGNYRYQWEMSNGDCGEHDFEPISGATGKDYVVPPGTTNNCYRRVVISGSCQDWFNKLKAEAGSQVFAVPPTAVVTQPTCAVPTGTIRVVLTLPVPGMTYSIDGVSYNNTTGVFGGPAPGIYKLTAKYPLGCVSPENKVTIHASQAASAPYPRLLLPCARAAALRYL